jgi:hypothetical protein
MSGGGHIIIRNAIKTALTDPLVSGALPPGISKEVTPVLATDTSTWDEHADKVTQHAFKWAMSNL